MRHLHPQNVSNLRASGSQRVLANLTKRGRKRLGWPHIFFHSPCRSRKADGAVRAAHAGSPTCCLPDISAPFSSCPPGIHLSISTALRRCDFHPPSPRCRSLNPLAAIKFNYVSSADVPRRSCQRVYGTAAVRGQHPSSPPVVSWRRSSLPVAVWPPRQSNPRALRGCWDLPDISPCFAINILVATACPERSAVFIPEMPRFCIFLAVHPGGGTHFAGSLVHGNPDPS